MPSKPMLTDPTILTVVGARPEFVKAAPVSRAGACLLCLMALLGCGFAASPSQVAAAKAFRFQGMAIGFSQTELRTAIPAARRDPYDPAGVTGAIEPSRGQEKWTAGDLPGGTNAAFEFLDSACYAMSWFRACDKQAFVKAVDSLEGELGPHHTRNGNSYGWLFDGMGRQFTLSFEQAVGMSAQVLNVKVIESLVADRTGGP